jgi:hypothetical protein
MDGWWDDAPAAQMTASSSCFIKMATLPTLEPIVAPTWRTDCMLRWVGTWRWVKRTAQMRWLRVRVSGQRDSGWWDEEWRVKSEEYSGWRHSPFSAPLVTCQLEPGERSGECRSGVLTLRTYRTPPPLGCNIFIYIDHWNGHSTSTCKGTIRWYSGPCLECQMVVRMQGLLASQFMLENGCMNHIPTVQFIGCILPFIYGSTSQEFGDQSHSGIKPSSQNWV